MLRRIGWFFFGVVAIVLLLLGVVNMLAVPMGELPPPDPTMQVAVPGGSRPLGDILSAADGDDSSPSLPVVENDSETPAEPNPDATGTAAARTDENPSMPTSVDLEAFITRLQTMTPAERQAFELQRIEEGLKDELAAGDVYALARYNEALGKTEEALALYRSVPVGHPQYGRTQRRIGWDYYAKELGEPARGVPFVHASLAKNPTDGNAWQDAARVYVHTLGLDFLD